MPDRRPTILTAGTRAAGMEIVDQLTVARERRGMTQQDLASAIGVSRSTVARWEGGIEAPSFWRLIAWAEAVGHPLSGPQRQAM